MKYTVTERLKADLLRTHIPFKCEAGQPAEIDGEAYYRHFSRLRDSGRPRSEWSDAAAYCAIAEHFPPAPKPAAGVKSQAAGDALILAKIEQVVRYGLSAALILLALIFGAVAAKGQNANVASVVAACGTPPATYPAASAGNPVRAFMTVNTDGELCIAGTISAMVTGADGAILDGADSMIAATVKDYANANPVAVVTVDTNGDYAAGGGGVQYTEADTDASITGAAMLMEGAGNALVPLQGTAAAGLLVNVSDAFALESGGNLDAISALLGAIDADTGNLAAIAASLGVLDDWDESDRAKVNIIAGQAGATGGAGAVAANTQRVTLASDDPAVALLATIDADTSTVVGLILGTQADNIANTADGLQATNFNMVFDGSTWDRLKGDSTDGMLVNLGANNDVTVTGTVTVTDGAGALNVIVDSGTVTTVSTVTTLSQFAGSAINLGSGAIGTGTLRVAVATDDPVNDALVKLDAALVVEDAGETAAANLIGVGTVRRVAAVSSAGATGDNATLNTDTLGLVWGRHLDPCSGVAKTQFVVNLSTAGTTEIANSVASEFFYVCSINLTTAAANNILIAEDDTDGCGSISAGLNGGTTSATGWQFAANGGIALGNGDSSVMKTTTAARFFCIAISASTQTSGSIMYVSAP